MPAAAGRFEGTTMGINLPPASVFTPRAGYQQAVSADSAARAQRASAQNVVVMGAAQAPAMNWTIGLDGSNRPVINIYLRRLWIMSFRLGFGCSDVVRNHRLPVLLRRKLGPTGAG